MKIKTFLVALTFMSALEGTSEINGQALILPENFPQYTVAANDSPSDGYYFTVPTVTNQGPGYMIIMDNYGTPIYYRYFGTFIGSLSVQPNGMLSFRHRNPTVLHHFLMDSTYNIVDTIETITAKLDAHDIIAMTNGHYLIFGTETRIVDMREYGGKEAASVIEVVIQELDENENLVFEWKSTDKFQLTDSYYDLTVSSIDYMHPNSLELDQDGNILLQSRFLDELTKISRETGEIMWRMGGKQNQFTFSDTADRFSWAHDARRLDNGHLTMFDNGFMRDEKYSRAVEYEVDEVNKTVNMVWSYDADKKIYSPTTGSTRRLSNGNTVIGYGFDVSKPAIVEVNPDNSIAFSLDFPTGAGSYRSLKFPWRTTLFEPITYSVEFGEWDGYTTSTYLMPIKNNSDQVLTLTSYSTRTEAFSIDDSFPVNIPANGTVNLTINYYPESLNTGYITDVLTINSDINTAPLVQRISQQIDLSGTKADNEAPVVTIPQNGEENLPQDTPIYINFDEAVRLTDNTVFDYLNVDPIIVLKKNNSSGADVPFNAVISTDKNKITIRPESLFDHNQTYYVEVKNGFEDYSNNAGSAKGATFRTVDLIAPTGHIIPSDGSINIDPSSSISIQYNEPVRKIDNTELTGTDLELLISLKLTDESGANVNFTGSINSEKTIITIAPSVQLQSNTVYYVATGESVEDFNNNMAAAISSTFTTAIETDITPDQLLKQITVYPNPGTGIFRTDVPSEEDIRLIVIDMGGKRVHEKILRGENTYLIDLSSYPDGVYLLKVEIKGLASGKVIRLVKQK